jgi:hypothetical protein
LRDTRKVEHLQPLSEIVDGSDLLRNRVRVNKFLNDFFHLFNITLSIEWLWSQMSWFELLELQFVVLFGLHNFTLWDQF